MEKGKTVVIIGDWFIDENWLMSKHESYSSSHIGNIHYLSKHKFNKRMISLCGAPELLVALKSYFDDKHQGMYEFIGFGAWNKYDEDILQCTFCPKQSPQKRITPFALKSLLNVKIENNRRYCPYEINTGKCNKNESTECNYALYNLCNLAKTELLPTNRIIRCYEGHGGDRPNLLYRFDWQLPIDKENDLDYNKFDNLQNKDIAAVVIEDHGKGVINDISIKKLSDRLNLKEVNWYVRSKIDNPKWMEVLKNNSDITVRLNVIDYKLAEHWHGKRSWNYGKVLSRAALETLGDLTGDTIYKHGNPVNQDDRERGNYISKRAAIIFDNNTAIAKDGDTCFNFYRSVGEKQKINVGRTTMFCAALIAQDLSDPNRMCFGTQCHNSLLVAHKWSEQASNAWQTEEPHFYGNYQSVLNNYLNLSNKEIVEPFKRSYKNEWLSWNSSSSDYGIVVIEDNNKLTNRKFQLWRGK